MIRNIKEQRFQKITTVVDSVWMCIKTFAYVIILSPVILSCSFSDNFDDLSDSAASSSAPVNINLTVSTRADNTSTVESANETEIRQDDYRIYFFDNTENHNYICTFKPVDFFITPSSGSNTSYSVSGSLDAQTIQTIKDNSPGEFIVVFIANWEHYPEDADMDDKSIDDLCSGNITTTTGFTAKFDCPTTLTKETLQNLYMPFYGVTTYEYDSETLTEGEKVDLGDISLLRAMAKVTVVNVTQTQTRATYYPEIYNVQLVHYNKEGYCAPYQVYTSDVYSEGDTNAPDNYYMRDEDDNYYVKDLHLPLGENTNETQNPESTTTVADDNPYIAMYQTNDTTWIAYVPEFYNSGAKTEYSDTCYVKYNVKCEKLKDGVSTDNPSADDYEYNYTYKYDLYNENDYNATTLSFAEYNDDGILIDDNQRYDIKRNKSYRFNVSLPKVFNLTASDKSGDDVGEWYVKKKSDD